LNKQKFIWTDYLLVYQVFILILLPRFKWNITKYCNK